MIEIKAPASKSCAQRAIVAASLVRPSQWGDRVSIVQNVGTSHDVLSAIRACTTLGATIIEEGNNLTIKGIENLDAKKIDVGESGLLTRLITPIAALSEGKVEIVGQKTINSRPMKALIEAVAQLGVSVSSNDAYLPLVIDGKVDAQKIIRIDGSGGSQVLSGMLMCAPMLKKDMSIEVENLQSKPYIDLTINVLSRFGIEIINNNYQQFHIAANQFYTPTTYTVEGDWSSASYFLAADAICGGQKIKVRGLDPQSTQADSKIMEVINLATANDKYLIDKSLTAFEFDASNSPDLFPTLVALASFCQGKSRIIGTSRLAHKESARDVVLQKEWAKFGVAIDLSIDNTMIINGLGRQKITQTQPIDPHNDHRIAMAAAIMGRGVKIENRGVVAKSFPQFWVDYQRIEHLLEAISTK